MAEHLSHSGEKHERKIHTETPETTKHERHEQRHKTPEREKYPDRKEIEHRAKQEAQSRHETRIDELDKTPQEPAYGVQRELKAQAYRQTLQKVRSHLTPTERSFSKFIHQPLVESVSELSGKTVARPSGILGGGIVALLGSGVLLYMSKHYGFGYNFFVYILLFVIGFSLGVVLELLLRTKRSNSA